ncbi:hypothetical protein [Halosimplex pelagicum]|uniref:Uncharacterized protein n=1 Tax=Halosimplex pelagicum TaxID=869886 RepID=A0A7D5T5H5_9EURY|nr:hypothetical protein [Halosimplex pelagicum]QLH83431.1 hypothetical protein HZS54_18130 [Halosimplex pelagicum]
MTAFGLPIGPDSERAWFVGLAVILFVSALVGLVVFPNVEVAEREASINVSGLDESGSAQATVERVDGGESETVAETTIEGPEATLYMATEAGLFYVSVETADGSCHRRVELGERGQTGMGAEWIGDRAPECPATLSVET